MLGKLEAFLEVAKTKNITKAADNLFSSQPSISMKIKALENQLGIKLFDRTKKMMNLTEEGEMFLGYSESIYHLFTEAITVIHDYKDLNLGSLSISTGPYYGSYVLPNMLGDFKSKFPNINIQIEVAKTENVIQDIMVNNRQLGFISEFDLVNRYPYLVCKPLFEDELIFVCSSQHACATLDTIDLQLHTDETFIMADRKSALRRTIEDKLQKHNISFRNFISINDVESIKRSVENNLGISILPRLSMERELELGFLKTVPMKNFSLNRKIFYIYRKDKILSRAAKEFLKMAINHHQN